jgi:ABC-type phosphate transport system permease subunit
VAAQERNDPIMVRVVEQPVRETTVGDVIVGSLVLVGVMLVAALLLGLALGGLLVAFKKLTARDAIDPHDDAQNLRVTPTS